MICRRLPVFKGALYHLNNDLFVCSDVVYDIDGSYLATFRLRSGRFVELTDLELYDLWFKHQHVNDEERSASNMASASC